MTLAMLAAGLGLVILQTSATRPPSQGSEVSTEEAEQAGGEGLRDRIAAAPMASLDASAAIQPDPATQLAPPIQIPVAENGRGPAGVAVFGHSSEGAVGQLAAIDQAVLEAMSIPQAREVHTAWVMPGGPSFDEWDLTGNVTAFLRGARQGATKDASTVVQATPVGGLIKGSDGPDWVLACVLLDVRASVQVDYRMGWGNCHRMQWSNERWQIAPGAQPAKAPSAWPGSKEALAAGWLTWSSVEEQPR